MTILKLLDTWGALGFGQILGACPATCPPDGPNIDHFFNESFRYEGGVYLRLRRLERLGLVRKYRVVNFKQLYGLTRDGHRLLARAGRSPLPAASRSVSPGMQGHRLACAAVGLTISRILGLRVLSEREAYYSIRANFGGRFLVGFRLPDLIVHGRSRRFPVEIELHLKTRRRYRAIWDFYGERLRGSDRLIYLTATEASARRLLRLAGKREAEFLFASDLVSFRRAAGRVRFVNFRGEECELA
ncbi:MAG: hypothetical protein ABII00_01275 [Elusimicrobiota bacterium]